MAEADQGEKTEEPTQQRREDFRKRGQVAQTRELALVLLLAGSALSLWILGGYFMRQILLVYRMSFGTYLLNLADKEGVLSAFRFALEQMLFLLAPLLLIFLVMSLASSILQVGFLQNEEALKMDWERLNPAKGLQRIFSLRSLVEGAKAIAKVIVVAAIAGLIIKNELVVLPQVIHFSVNQLFAYVGDVTLKILGGIGIFMTVLAGFDYLFQRWDLEQKMRMTKQELKEEHKAREGDPLIKTRIRRIQREMAQRRMMEEVPRADVIVTNPQHIACALKYDAENMVAPKLVAKGADLIAEKIKAVARENNVPIVENKPLARTIYKTMKLGQVIPRELYKAVAEVLSYVFKLKKRVVK